jgi:hypothetical protein
MGHVEVDLPQANQGARGQAHPTRLLPHTATQRVPGRLASEVASIIRFSRSRTQLYHHLGYAASVIYGISGC